MIKVPEYILKTRHVNSKRLLKQIAEFIEEIIVNFSIMWDSDVQRGAVLEVIDEYMEDLVEDKDIEQWNVICDSRNNKMSDIQKKQTHLDITYRQRNCFNVTEIKYTIKQP